MDSRVLAEKERREQEEREALARAQREAREREERDRERDLQVQKQREEEEDHRRQQQQEEEQQRQAAAADEEDRKRKLALEEQERVRATAISSLKARPASSVGGIQGVCAVVLYAYQAQEENEIDLDEEEVITHIEKLDEGWWQGVNSKGKTGLFPANYVQEIESAAFAGAPVMDPKPVAVPEPEPEPEPVPAAALGAGESLRDAIAMVCRIEYCTLTKKYTDTDACSFSTITTPLKTTKYLSVLEIKSLISTSSVMTGGKDA
jgi:hypothetical protein